MFYERTQIDGLQGCYSVATGISFIGAVDCCRQEFRAETDVNSILKRFGASFPAQLPAIGVRDFTVDLQRALQLVNEGEAAYRRLAPEVKAEFKSWRDVAAAADSGYLERFFKKLTAEQAAVKAAADAKAAEPATPAAPVSTEPPPKR